jgi:hypothetical protein
MNKFKVGDWVKVKRLSGDFVARVRYVNSETTLVSDGNDIVFAPVATLWQPKEGEFVFATDKTKVCLVEFIGFYEERYVCKHLDGFSETFDIVEPFIGELPSWLKGKK